MELLGLSEWLTRLAADNDAYDALFMKRNDATATRSKTRMMQVRYDTQQAYRAIVEMIEAGIVFKGEATYAPFVEQVNALLTSYADVMNIRAGIADARKEKEGKEEK